MKRIELIIPDCKLKDAHAILKNVNSGGMSYYTQISTGNPLITLIFVLIGPGLETGIPAHTYRVKV
ncbi:MAG: hypothetical protein WA667_29860 [Candidatus Nitrosopolaris sp.]